MLNNFDAEDPYNSTFTGRVHGLIHSLSFIDDSLTWDNPEMDEPNRPPEHDVIELTN